MKGCLMIKHIQLLIKIYFKNIFKISALILGFTLISCHNNAHLRTQKLLKPGEKVISANTTILIGGERDWDENENIISQQPNGVLGGRGEFSFLFGGQNSEYGPYLAYGFNGGLGYIYPGIALGYGTKKYIKFKSENWWKVGGDIELDITPLGRTIHFLPTILKSSDLYNPIYWGIHGIYTYGNKLKRSDFYRYSTKTPIENAESWEEPYSYEFHEYDQEYIYNINTTGLGLTLGYEDLAIKDQSFQFQINISIVKNTFSSNSIPPDISNIPDVVEIEWLNLPNQNDFHPVISCNIGINSFEGIRGLFNKKEKTFYNPNTGDRINNIFSEKSRKNIFKSATLISNGAFLGLAAGVYLGIIDP